MSATILAVSEEQSFHSALRDLPNRDPDFQLVGEARNGEQAVRSTSEFHPDIVLMDATAPHLNGFDATRKIKSCRPYTKVIALAMQSAINYGRGILGIGPDAFIAKTGMRAELLPTIRQVLAPSPHAPRRETERAVAVFMVDDEGDFLAFAADYLRAQPGIAMIECAQSGKEALTRIPRLKPDVALIDLEVPDVPGMEVMRGLRPALPGLGIIAFSSLSLRRYSRALWPAQRRQ